MPKIFELLGYPIENRSTAAELSRKHLLCPFTGTTCNGGGNRYMAEISLSNCPELKEFFSEFNHVPCGVCSLQIHKHQPPWIICPRRLLYMGKKADQGILLGSVQRVLLEKCNFQKGIQIGIWSEIKVRYKEQTAEDSPEFDYTFDYILMPIGRIHINNACVISGIKQNKLERELSNSGFTFVNTENGIFIENFPIGNPIIVEVMTSSTSGGNKTKRSCITQAFEDGILGKTHSAPGINYRQVWARMASQLIVKSQAGLAWGGKTIWVLQDTLANYISSSTALKLNQFISRAN